MKKISTLIMLLMMICIGAKADKLGTDGRFYASILSFSKNGLQGGEVTVAVDKDFTTTVTLPNASADQIYSSKVMVTVEMQKIDAFGIDEPKTYTKTMTSNTEETRHLSIILENCYAFTGTKTFTVKVSGKSVTFNVTKTGNTIVAKPTNVEAAREAWSEIKKHISHEKVENKTYFSLIKGGSYVINGNEKLSFTKDCTFSNNDKNLRSNLNKFLDATELSPIVGSNKSFANIEALSEIILGTQKVTLNDNCSISIDNAGHSCYIEDYLGTVKDDVNQILKDNPTNDSDLKKDFISKSLSWLKLLDDNVKGKFPCTVDINFNQEENNVRYSMSVSSFDKDGNPGGVVSMTVDKDFKTVVTLPDANAKIYSNKVKVNVTMQKISAFGIDEPRSYTKELNAAQSEERTLYTYLQNCYDFTGTKSFTVNTSGKTVTFNATKEGNIITMVPNSIVAAQEVWAEITKHLTAKTDATAKSKLFIKEGSHIINGNEDFKFIKDCTFDNTKLRESLKECQDATELYPVVGASKIFAEIAPSSEIFLGSTSLTLNDACSISVDNTAHNCFINDFFKTIKADVNQILDENPTNDSALKKDYISKSLGWLKILDNNVKGKFPCTVDIEFNVLMGDATNDGKVDTEDAVRVISYYLDNKIEINKIAADMNNDGKIDTEDAVAIRTLYLNNK